MKKRLFALTSALILVFAAIAMAAPVPTIQLVPNGTSFSVMANNFTKVSGFEMTIQYNPLALENPQITPGDMVVGGIFIPNVTASRSTVRLVLTNAFKSIEGAGKLATVSFAPIAGGAAKGNVNILAGYIFKNESAKRTVRVDLISSAEQNQGKLDNDAIVACLNNPSTCTAKIKPDGTVDLQYKDNTPASATCGSASGSRLSTKPASNLCSVGTPSAVNGEGPWVWKCDGESGGASANCSADRTSDVTKGVCGPANGVTTSSMPTFNLCTSGTPSDVTESGSWNWSCSGLNGGASASCSAPTPVSLAAQYATQTGQTPSVAFASLPPDQMSTATDKKSDSQPLVTDLRKDMTIPVGGAETPAAASGKKPAEPAKEAEPKFVSYKAALQFFATYKGERNPKSLIALFAEPAIPSFTQDPPIALADGKGLVKIKLQFNASGAELPKFIMQGATLKRLPALGEDGSWSMEALPKKDVYEAKLTVIDGERMLEFPLTVAPVTVPLLGKDKKFSEADFARFLAKQAKYDLNRDKKFDYIDDFIYTANYITALKIKPEKLKKDEPKKVEDGKKKEPPKSKDGKVKDEMEKAAPKPVKPVKKVAEPAGQK